MILAILVFPLLLSLILFIVKSRLLNTFANFIYSCLYIVGVVYLWFNPESVTAYFSIDYAGKIFISVLGILYFCVSLYNISYLEESDIHINSHTYYSIFFLLFVFSMTGAMLSTHLGLFWVFLEATTLSSAYLIYFSKTSSSLEAAWKYIFICSIGISLSFVGIILLSLGMGELNSLFFEDLYKNVQFIQPFWLKLSYVFILFGFGTKIGLAPMHAWLPDAHSEAPSPVSAMLSGTLLNTALLGIIRFNKIMRLAGLEDFIKILLLITGFISLFVSAVFIIRVRNYKRMLAYSSIENMGIIAIALGIGGSTLSAVFIQVIAHSLAKASLFLTSGNILHLTGTKNIEEVKGILQKSSTTAWLWMLSFIGIAGIPPSPIFLSEFIIIKNFINNNQIFLLILFLLLITIIIAGMGNKIFNMCWGEPISGEKKLKTRLLNILPQLLLLILLFGLGSGMPSIVNDLINRAIEFLW